MSCIRNRLSFLMFKLCISLNHLLKQPLVSVFFFLSLLDLYLMACYVWLDIIYRLLLSFCFFYHLSADKFSAAKVVSPHFYISLVFIILHQTCLVITCSNQWRSFAILSLFAGMLSESICHLFPPFVFGFFHFYICFVAEEKKCHSF